MYACMHVNIDNAARMQWGTQTMLHVMQWGTQAKIADALLQVLVLTLKVLVALLFFQKLFRRFQLQLAARERGEGEREGEREREREREREKERESCSLPSLLQQRMNVREHVVYATVMSESRRIHRLVRRLHYCHV